MTLSNRYKAIQDPTICCLQEMYLKNKYKNKAKVKGWKKMYRENINYRKSCKTLFMAHAM